MKLLLEQQRTIFEVYKGTEGAGKSDLIDALNQHLTEVSKNVKLLPIGDVREECEDLVLCTYDTIGFKTIGGSFCPHCGMVYPF